MGRGRRREGEEVGEERGVGMRDGGVSRSHWVR